MRTLLSSVLTMLFASTVLVALCAPANAGFSFITIDPPGSVDTEIEAINNNSDVAGYYTIADGEVLGFVKPNAGDFNSFHVKHSNNSEAEGLDDKGQVTGWFFGNNTSTCFLYKGRGKALICGPLSQQFSIGTAINGHGVVTGYFGEEGEVEDHAFLWDKDNGATVFDAPGAFDTQPIFINDTGSVTGNWDDADGNTHGFVRDPGGAVTEFDVPGAAITLPKAINASGVVSGYYFTQAEHSFIRDASGNIITYDPKGALASEAFGINKKGVVVGGYSDNQGTHGFERLPSGKIRSFDVTGATRTVAGGINDDAHFVGVYTDAGGIKHGLLGLYQ